MPNDSSQGAASTRPVRLCLVHLFRHSAFRYLVIGGSSFLIDLGLLAILHAVLAWPLWLATGTSFLTTFLFNYSLQRSFSFGSRGAHGTTLAKYLALLAFNTLATIVIVWMVNQTGWGWGIGKFAATVATTAWNYFVFRYWVFAPQHSSHPRRAENG